MPYFFSLVTWSRTPPTAAPAATTATAGRAATLAVVAMPRPIMIPELLRASPYPDALLRA